MRVRNYFLRITAAVLLLLAVYAGICSFATLHRALTQPYLMAGEVRVNFMGYYFMSLGYGLLCILLLAPSVLLFVLPGGKRAFRKDPGAGKE